MYGRGGTLWQGLTAGFHDFSETIAAIINTVLLVIVYLIGVGLTAIVAKLAGKHFFALRINKRAKSYYRKLDLGTRPIEEYYKQF